MSDPGSWRRIPVRQVVTELSRLNAGQRPCSFADCKVIAARMHWRFRFLPREAEQDAYADELRHVIYLPNTTDEAELVQLAIHELSEILTHKDGGEPEFHYQGGAEEHHQVARLVEAHLAAMSRRIQTFNVVGETPPPPGDLEAPPLDLDYLVLPNAVTIRTHYKAALASDYLDEEEQRLLQQLTRVREAKALVHQQVRQV